MTSEMLPLLLWNFCQDKLSHIILRTVNPSKITFPLLSNTYELQLTTLEQKKIYQLYFEIFKNYDDIF